MSKSSDAKIENESKYAIRSSPNDLLSLDYNKYKNSVYALSLSQPAEYFRLREECENALIDSVITDLYEKIYTVLRDGKIKSIGSVTGDRYVGHPSNLTNELCLSVTSSLQRFLIDEVLEKLFPANNLSLASSKLIAQNNAV